MNQDFFHHLGFKLKFVTWVMSSSEVIGLLQSFSDPRNDRSYLGFQNMSVELVPIFCRTVSLEAKNILKSIT